jgi:PAS domain S-box-containing protein
MPVTLEALGAAFHHSALPQWVFDGETLRFLAVNDAAVGLYGYSRAAFLAMTILDIRPAEDAPAVRAAVAGGGLPAGVALSTRTWRHLRRSGELRVVRLSSVPIDFDGRAAFLAQVFDLTEELRGREQLADAVRHEQEALHAISHELRQPLSALAAAANLLEREHTTARQRSLAVEVVARQVRHLTRLTDDLLDAARLGRGRMALHRERVDLRHLVSDVVSACAARFDRAHVALRHDLPRDPVVVEGDATRLSQVLQNLLDNAAKFTPGGGVVSVMLRREGESLLLLEVTDTGAGIDPALLPRVFDRFVQGAPGVGLGIGLALVRDLVALHGGSVTAHSEGPGRGSRIAVTLPVPAVDPAAAPV